MLIDTHFGHATSFYIYDVTAKQLTFIEARSINAYCSGKEDCDEAHTVEASTNSLSNHLKALEDCQQVLCSRIGIDPWEQLEKQNVLPNVDFAMLGVTDALNMIRATLSEPLVTCNDKTQLQEVC